MILAYLLLYMNSTVIEKIVEFDSLETCEAAKAELMKDWRWYNQNGDMAYKCIKK